MEFHEQFCLQRDYNSTINPTLANAVASAAFRFGHSLVRNSLSRCSKDFKELPFFVKLHKEFNDPSNIHNLGSVDRLMLGLLSKSMAKRDEFIAQELTNHLFQVFNSFRPCLQLKTTQELHKAMFWVEQLLYM